MSADLFAAFGGPIEPAETRQTRENSVTSTRSNQNSSDPFSFLTSNTPSSQAQPQPLQERAPWPSQPQVQAQDGNGWGDFTDFSAAPAVTCPAVAKDVGLDDDGWGDFEVAPQTKPTVPSIDMHALAKAAASTIPEPEFSPRTRILRAPTLDLIANKLVDIGSLSKVEPWQERPSWDNKSKQDVEKEKPKPKPKPKPTNEDPNVLFDADDFDGEPLDEENEDDFGEFETVPSQAPVPAALGPASVPSAPAVDLLGLDSEPLPSSTRKQPPVQLLSTLSLQSSPYPNAPRSPSFHERNPFPGLGLTTPKAAEFPKEVKEKEPSPVTAWPTVENDVDGGEVKRNSFENEWAGFELDSPAEPKNPRSGPLKIRGGKHPSIQQRSSERDDQGWGWDDWEKPDTRAASKEMQKPVKDVSGPPPTNVPPPSILLSLFPELLNFANDTLLKPLNGKPVSVKDRVLSDPATIGFIRGYLALATVAARVIAGRKLRWHRDKFLAQSMTISAAGGKGGMKLAGIDKSQAAREDREAADVVLVWRDVVGRLRGAVAAANNAMTKEGYPPLRVPELSENVAVQTAKNVATAPKPCIICGLKRDERVPRVDIDVEDSFGEWWVEFWGHRACRNFWVEHSTRLKQR